MMHACRFVDECSNDLRERFSSIKVDLTQTVVVDPDRWLKVIKGVGNTVMRSSSTGHYTDLLERSTINTSLNDEFLIVGLRFRDPIEQHFISSWLGRKAQQGDGEYRAIEHSSFG